jgi:hypothetical protein
MPVHTESALRAHRERTESDRPMNTEDLSAKSPPMSLWHHGRDTCQLNQCLGMACLLDAQARSVLRTICSCACVAPSHHRRLRRHPCPPPSIRHKATRCLPKLSEAQRGVVTSTAGVRPTRSARVNRAPGAACWSKSPRK